MGKLQGSVQGLKEDIEEVKDEYDELERVIESLDNNQRKNNLKLRGLKEGEKGKDLTGYLIDILSTRVGSDSETEVSTTSAY